MPTVYLATTLVFVLMVLFSGIGKIRRDPRQVKVVHETTGVPLDYFRCWLGVSLPGRLDYGWNLRPQQGCWRELVWSSISSGPS